MGHQSYEELNKFSDTDVGLFIKLSNASKVGTDFVAARNIYVKCYSCWCWRSTVSPHQVFPDQWPASLQSQKPSPQKPGTQVGRTHLKINFIESFSESFIESFTLKVSLEPSSWSQ